MIQRRNIILYNVLNQEVVFEEYFCNLLQIDDFRNLFIKYISTKTDILSKENIQYKHFNTEVILNGEDTSLGRADLFLKINNKEFIFEIKNKEYTQLTQNQPISYLKYLEQKNNEYNKHLFFLIPKNYKHKDGIFQKWENYPYPEIEKQLLYWEEFIKYINIQNKTLIETNHNIRDFYDFCLHWFDIKPIVFKKEEIELLTTKGQYMSLYENTSLPEAMEKLQELVVRIGRNSGLKSNISEVGFYYDKNINNNFYLSFGIDYGTWKTNSIPLNIFIQSIENDYQEFKKPEIPNVELEAFEHEETSFSVKQFSFVVKQNISIDNQNYEEGIEELISNIINSLSCKI